MQEDKRRVLTEGEKKQLLDKRDVCYICQKTFDGYTEEEIEFDHIYSYADGYPQELSNFAPVHASDDLRKLNCHGAKGRKSPFVYREELRIRDKLKEVSGLKDLCPNALQSSYSISEDKRHITINGEVVSLYDQKLNGKDNFYFFHEIETKYLENDEEIQLRPLEPKILPMIFNLKEAVQLLPSLGRLEATSKKIKIFDGQHKAVAQIIGNNKTKLPCIVFVNPNVDEMRVVIYQAHTDFVQQRYKKSHIDEKLADIYRDRIEAFRKSVGDPDARYSEADIMKGETKANIRRFLLAALIREINLEINFIRDYVAQDRREQKIRPVLWQSLERLIREFCKLDPVSVFSDDNKNYRSDEIENVCFLIDLIEKYSIRGKWEPDNPESKLHLLSRTYYYRTAFNNWIGILREALSFALEQMRGSKIYEPLCFRPSFSPEIKSRFIVIVKKLFEHPLWVQESIQNEIAQTNLDAAITEVFKREGLDYIYLTKL